jgi:transcriptional regulator with XRE-family HTH domain
MSLPLRIRDLRKERGLTLAQLAEVVGISVPHMSQVERGVKNVNNHLLERIARALRVEPYQLIVDGPPDRGALMEVVALLSAEDQERVETFARGLLLSKAPPRG